MFLEIVSPEARLFSGEVASVTVPGVSGEFQMLENHAAIVSTLQGGKVKFSGNNTEIEEAFQSKFQKDDQGNVTLSINSGTVEMSDNKVIVLVD